MTAERLKHPPITEAIVDFRVKPKEGFNANEFTHLKDELKEVFPVVDERVGSEVQIRFEKELQAPTLKQLGLQGYFFKSHSQREIVQYRVDGFTVNKLAPYSSWNELFSFAMQYWNLYAQIAKPEAVIRLAVRYLNKIAIPSEAEDFDEILVAGPKVPENLPQVVSAFASRIRLEDEATLNQVNIGQSLQLDSSKPTYSIILDIDAFRAVDLSVDSAEIQEIFESLRALKNRVFFSLLTPKALEKFDDQD